MQDTEKLAVLAYKSLRIFYPLCPPRLTAMNDHVRAFARKLWRRGSI